jgi:hypothetical protein
MAALCARDAPALPRRCLGTRDEATRREPILPPWETGHRLACSEQHAAAPLAQTRHGWPPRPRGGVLVRGGLDERQRQSGPQWGRGREPRQGDRTVGGPRGSDTALGPPHGALGRRSAGRLRARGTGDGCGGPGRRVPPVCAAAGAGVGGGRGARAAERDRQTPAGAGHHGGRQRSLGNRSDQCGLCRHGSLAASEHAPGHRPGPLAPPGWPGHPRETATRRPQRGLRGQGRWPCARVPVRLAWCGATGLLQPDAHCSRPCSARGEQAHSRPGGGWWRIAGGLLRFRACLFPTLSIPRGDGEEEASSMSIGLQATADSVRSCVAPASSRA